MVNAVGTPKKKEISRHIKKDVDKVSFLIYTNKVYPYHCKGIL